MDLKKTKHPQTDLRILYSQEQHHQAVGFCCFLSVKPHSEEKFFLCVSTESSQLPLLPLKQHATLTNTSFVI